MAGIEDLNPEQQKALHLGSMLLSNPEVSNKAKRLAREVQPNLRLPEIDLEDQINQLREENRVELEKRDKELMEERVRTRRAEQDAKIREAGFDPADIEKLIVEEKFGSYDAALKFAELRRQAAEPGPADAGWGGRTPYPRDLRGDEEWRKEYAKGGMGALRQKSAGLAHQMIDDALRNARRGR
jgi:hypothetical protein